MTEHSLEKEQDSFLDNTSVLHPNFTSWHNGSRNSTAVQPTAFGETTEAAPNENSFPAPCLGCQTQTQTLCGLNQPSWVSAAEPSAEQLADQELDSGKTKARGKWGEGLLPDSRDSPLVPSFLF